MGFKESLHAVNFLLKGWAAPFLNHDSTQSVLYCLCCNWCMSKKEYLKRLMLKVLGRFRRK